IDYRYKALMDNSSQVEYFIDVLGDSAEFEEDTEGFLAFSGTNTINQNNGVLTITRTVTDNTWGLILLDGVNIASEIYHTLEIRAKGNTSINGMHPFWVFQNGSTDFNETGLSLTTEWQIQTLDLSSLNNWSNMIGSVEQLDIWFTSNGSVSIDIDYIKLIGDLDYATHAEGEIEDTWDWEDNNEYFHDEEGDAIDFDEGDTEGINDDGETLISHDGDNGLFVQTQTGSPSNWNIWRDSLTITASTYRYFAIELFPHSDPTANGLTQIDITDAGSNSVCSDSTGWAEDVWSLIICDLGLDGDWTSTETVLNISFTVGNLTFLRLNMVYLYDTELGDLDDWGNSINLQTEYIQPEGYYHFLVNPTSVIAIRTNSNPVDTSVFDIFVIRVKSNEVNTKFDVRDISTSTSYISLQTLTTSFVEYTFDLSLDSDWTGTESIFALDFFDSSGNFEGDERFTIDYILLLASTGTEQDFVVGFWDEDNSQALVNISHHFFTTTFRWEIELYDSNQEIASYYYSSNYTVVDVYYRAQIKYNLLEAEFEIKITHDNGTRIFSVDLFEDFTIINQFPSIFAFGRPPDIYLSTYTVFYGHQEIWIDFINAPFKEREWKQVTTPSDPEWLEDSWFFAYLEDDIAVEDNSKFQLTIPRLDSISGTISILPETATRGNLAVADEFYIFLKLYGVDADDGELHELVAVEIQYTVFGGGTHQAVAQTCNSATCTQKFVDDASAPFTIFPSAIFSISTTEDRNNISLSAQINFNDDNPFNLFTTAIVSDEVDLRSQEFVVETHYRAQFTGDTEVSLSLQNFAFISKDIFGDIGNFVGDVAGAGGDFVSNLIQGFINGLIWLLMPIFLLLGNLFRVVGEVIVNALSPLLALVVSALGDLASAIWSSLGPILEGFFDDIIGFVINIINDIWDDILVPILNLFLAALGIVFDAIIDAGQIVITAIFNWILGFLNLTEIADTTYQLFLLAVTLIFL
ncbi:hypothetical protein LCGC14_1721980, partial [marine sediment metagenome]